MAVQAGPTEKRYAANGVTTIYTIPFLLIQAGDLLVTLNGAVITSGFTLTGVGNPTSTITFSVAPLGDLYLVLSVPFERLVDYQENGDFLSSTVNRDYDRIWQALKQLFRYSTRTPMLGENDVDGAGAYRAKGNRMSDLGDPLLAQDAATRNWSLITIANLIAGANGNFNLASNVFYQGPDSLPYNVQDMSNKSDPLKGAALHGYKGRNVAARLNDFISIMDYDGANSGALGTGGNDLVAVQYKINQAQPLLGSVQLPVGKRFLVNSVPVNKAGVKFVGDGRLAVPENGGVWQLNTYGDDGPVIGREYLHRALTFIQTQDGDRTTTPAGGASSNLNILLEGDSTAVGYVANVGPTPVAPLPAYLAPAVAIKDQLNANGVRYVTVSNQAVSGTSWRDLSVIPDLSTTLGLIFIKFGINDSVFTTGGVINPQAPVADRIAELASVMDSKLSAIRSAPNGALNQVSIVLVGPTATADSPNGRNEEWYEQVRKVYVRMARKWQCCYIDPYPFIRDARTGGLLWMDQPDGGTQPGDLFPHTVHMRESAMAPLWAWIIDQLFPKEAFLQWGSTGFRNIGTNGNGEIANAATGPLGYRAGVTLEWATIAGGFPKPGVLRTERFADGAAKQSLTPVGALGGDNAMITRQTATSLTTWLTRWTGVVEALTPLNGWADFGAPASTNGSSIDEQGYVQLRGALKSGAITNGTTIAALLTGMRPAGTEWFACPTSTATMCQVSVDSTGAIIILSGGDATRISLSGIRFKAA